MRSARWLISYLVVAFVGLGMAFMLSLRFTSPAHSQTGNKLEAPSSGDLPAEFLNETGSSAKPSASVAPSPSVLPTATPAAKNSPPPKTISPTKDSTKEVAKVPPAVTPPSANSNDVNVGDSATAAATPPEANTGGAAEYVYDPTGRRDPFKPYRGIMPAEKGHSRDGKDPQLDPLQKWDVDRLEVVGILWEVHDPRAMIKDPDGLIYTIMKNTKIGRNNGYVAAIREGEVVVVQTVEFEGTINKETKILELGK